MGAPDTASCYRLDRKLTIGERELGVALVSLGLHPICVVALFSNRREKLIETRKTCRRAGDRKRRATPEAKERRKLKKVARPVPTPEERETKRLASKEKKRARDRARQAAIPLEVRRERQRLRDERKKALK